MVLKIRFCPKNFLTSLEKYEFPNDFKFPGKTRNDENNRKFIKAAKSRKLKAFTIFAKKKINLIIS